GRRGGAGSRGTGVAAAAQEESERGERNQEGQAAQHERAPGAGEESRWEVLAPRRGVAAGGAGRGGGTAAAGNGGEREDGEGQSEPRAVHGGLQSCKWLLRRKFGF